MKYTIKYTFCGGNIWIASINDPAVLVYANSKEAARAEAIETVKVITERENQPREVSKNPSLIEHFTEEVEI